jgi:hypothetical protein
MSKCHYSRIGMSMAPACADGEGYLHFRDGADRLCVDEQTASEQLIFGSSPVKYWVLVDQDNCVRSPRFDDPRDGHKYRDRHLPETFDCVLQGRSR